MATVQAQELTQVLEELQQQYPEMRFGQLVANVAAWAKGPTRTAVWDVEDDELVRAARLHLQQRTAPTRSEEVCASFHEAC